MSREVENYCLVSETGAELFIPNSENRRKVAEKHKEKKKTLLSRYEKLQNEDDVKGECSNWLFRSDNGTKKRAR